MSVAEPHLEHARRIKVYTVHGTFAHEASWDDWDVEAEPDDPHSPFVNRLSDFLLDEGIVFEQVDHEQYNWSGGNSHDERRIAAINLKRHIELDLLKQFQGANDVQEAIRSHYDGGVFVVGHSHGGTIARLAMNLWEKPFDYFEPLSDENIEVEIRHEDKCPVCKQSRGILEDRPNEIPRPDGVITFGSPFVRFEKRALGLASTKMLVWVLRVAGFIGAVVLTQLKWISMLGVGKLVHLLWPAVVFWLVTFYLPRRKNREGLRGKTKREKINARTIRVSRSILYWVALGILIYYYSVQFFSTDTGYQESWQLSEGKLQYLVPIVVYWVLLVSVPHRFLKRVGKEVEALRSRLPNKYDPEEHNDNPARYLCYHTPGDEAGLHLRVFGLITWLVQTLLLTAAVFFSFAIVLGFVTFLFLIFTNLINQIGLSPDASPARFAGFMNGLSEVPRSIWNFFAGPENDLITMTAEQVDGRVATRFGETLFFISSVSIAFLMPIIVVVIGLAYVISMSLRGSGLVFGSEKLTWTMANRISARRTANHMTKRRRFFIAPEAWWNLEMAHCYFYKSRRVIKDVAVHIATWDSGAFTPSRNYPVERMLAIATSWIIIMICFLGIFAFAANEAAEYAQTIEWPRPIGG